MKIRPLASTAAALATICVIGLIPAVRWPQAANSPVATEPTSVVSDAAASVRSAIERQIREPLPSSIHQTPAERAQLLALYQRNAYDALWLDSYARPARRASEAVALVSA